MLAERLAMCAGQVGEGWSVNSGAVLALAIIGCLAAISTMTVLVVVLRRGGPLGAARGRPEADAQLLEADTARLQADAAG